jgi:hypothetical protein
MHFNFDTNLIYQRSLMWYDRVEFDRNFLQNLGNSRRSMGPFSYAGSLKGQ